MPLNWKDITYLQAGSAPQQLAYRLLQRYSVLTLLKEYDPILVGTFPLDITVPGSDLDVICEVHGIEAFERVVASCFSQYPAYAVRYPVLTGLPSIVVSFLLEGVEVEVFGQPLATEQQNGYRHMVVEAQLLEAGGPEFKQRIVKLKASGIKTEPAFAQLLGLNGNPYEALIDLHNNKTRQNFSAMANNNITLTETEKDDLNIFFRFQLDQEANYLAAFTAKDSNNETAYIEKYTKFLSDPTINMRTIKVSDEIIGSIAKFVVENEAGITYWIDRKYWGKGIATTALINFLNIETTRPIYGHVAFDNYGSQKVLEKCGFIKVGNDKGFANARQAEIEEYIYKLSD